MTLLLLAGSCGGPAAAPAASPTASLAASKTAAPSFSAAAPGILRVRVGTNPCGILGAAGSIWVSNFNDNDLVRLDAKTGAAIGAPVPTGAQPCGLAEGAGSIWTADYAGNSTTRVD